jgi:hypothetical protein
VVAWVARAQVPRGGEVRRKEGHARTVHTVCTGGGLFTYWEEGRITNGQEERGWSRCPRGDR